MALAISLALVSFIWAGLQGVLSLVSSEAGRWAGRARVACLARMLVVGTGWGGDDAALLLFGNVRDARGLLEEAIQRGRAKGRDVSALEFALRLVGVG